jgi:hypothetical protein
MRSVDFDFEMQLTQTKQKYKTGWKGGLDRKNPREGSTRLPCAMERCAQVYHFVSFVVVGSTHKQTNKKKNDFGHPKQTTESETVFMQLSAAAVVCSTLKGRAFS